MATTAELMATATRFYFSGRLQQAEVIYRQIVQENPNHFDALHLLGVIAYQAGRHDLAVEYIRQALRTKPDSPEAYNNLGLALKECAKSEEAVAQFQQAIRLRPEFPEALSNLAGTLRSLKRYDEAIACCSKAISLKPGYVDAHDIRATIWKAQGKLTEAIAEFREALRLQPDNQSTLNNLGNALKAQGKKKEAEESYRAALRFQPGFASALSNLGVILAEQGEPEEALTHCQSAVALKPRHAGIQAGLGFVLECQGRLAEAMRCYRLALQLQPDHIEAGNNMGVLLKAQGHLRQAIECHRNVLRYYPENAPALNNLGNALRAQNRLDEAMASYQEALRHQPNYADAHINLAVAYLDKGQLKEVVDHFEEAVRLEPTPANRILLATVLPPFYESMDDLKHWRERLATEIKKLLKEKVNYRLLQDNNPPLFYLAYHGLNDREIQRDFARLFSVPASTNESAGRPARTSDSKIRIGFISRNLRYHTIGKLNQGLIAQLSRSRFAVTVFTMGTYQDHVSDFLKRHSDSYIELPLNRAAARRIVADQNLDVLFYTDIGMEPITFSLAFSRLAPVQCVTWGHPVTTGIQTVDYFISARDLESDGADDHYTETLVRLKRLPVYYYRPELPAGAKTRADFGLSEGCHLYGCPQSSFKFHPEFDSIIGSILQQDPEGRLILLKGLIPLWDEMLMNRFRTTIPDVVDQIQFVPRQDRDGFLSLNALFDVLLDPIHFGGGNTSYEGLAFGVPIVTLPSSFLRGRITYALYKQMNFLDCVVNSPEEYVALAVRLGTDQNFRAAISEKILKSNNVLFENDHGVRDLEEFFEQAVASARQAAEKPSMTLSETH